ncbi:MULTISPECIES: hypothetical protein [Amycolatopsis]|uniref:hypothetical protein n=1 Tax=Amycolatopsis TaxID=1813 RepID=UPI0007E00912|nr:MULTISPECIES: hypothetical protein [Amycolatopsis]OAP29042.1 hypothetical protein A4R44_00836 [Amycolatopsis sp. M39]
MVDLRLNHDSAGGSIEKDRAALSLVRVGDRMWIKVTRALTKIAGALSTMDGKWLSVDAPLLHVAAQG